MGFIDWHCHVLPELDDGSQDVKTSIEMLKYSKSMGVDYIIATPHFYANRNTPDRFVGKRRLSLEMLREGMIDTIRKEKITVKDTFPHVILGAEVAWFSGLGHMEEIDALCIAGTNLVLVEMPFSQWSSYTIREIEGLLRRKYRPIIAHLDRYYSYQKDRSIMEELLELPVVVQFNAEALETFSGRRNLYHLLDDNKMVLFGSDAHGMNHRAPNLDKARLRIKKKYGQDMMDALDEYAVSVYQRSKLNG